MFSLGTGPTTRGGAAGKLVVRIPKGESPASMPFEPLTPTTLLLQADTLVTP